MRRIDETPIDPQIAAELDAIDATLAGEPVDPRHAEIAELALLLAAGRPQIDAEFAESLDQRVRTRFAAGHLSAQQPGRSADRPGRQRHSAWRWTPGLGAGAAAGLAGIVALVIVAAGGLSGGGPGGGPGGGRGGGTARTSVPATAHASGTAVSGAATSAASSSSSPQAPSTAASAMARTLAAALRSQPIQARSTPPPPPSARIVGPAGTATLPGHAPAGAVSGTGVTLQPPANGRKIVQSAQLVLTTAPARIDGVAQEVFDVMGAENGIVNSSNVTATGGSDGSAQFQLSVPSSVLPQTMAALSRLRYASVASRTDITQDVNGQFIAATRRLADARALRTALLKQLAGAVTQQQIDSLKAQIHDAEATIGAAEGALGGLGHQINFSQIALSIAAGAPPVPVAHGSAFTIGQAAHDAGRVLTVAAGVALVALAALVPIGLLAVLGWWIAVLVRHRRREQTLDLA